MDQISDLIKSVASDLFNQNIETQLVVTDEQFGDFSTNIALRLSPLIGKNPSQIADELITELAAKINSPDSTLAGTELSLAGPGFINIKLPSKSLKALVGQFATGNLNLKKSLQGAKVVCEYSDPNPFKILHAGHLYTSVVGDAIANLLEKGGAKVYRVNFGGDIGLHVAKSMWAIINNLGGENFEKLSDIPESDRAKWLASRYVEGNNAYSNNPEATQSINLLNKRLYQVIEENDHGSQLARIYWTCRQWSYDYLGDFYKSIGTKFDKYYPESETAPLGLSAVKEQQKNGIFEESEGAVVYKGEVEGLHTRVFVTKEGLPTYETKDVGLLLMKAKDYNFDRSIVITGNDIVDYMRVVLAAVKQFEPDLVARTTHITHGMVKLAGGLKMSSRQGNVLLAEDILGSVKQANQQLNDTTDEQIALGAVKYSFLKQRLGADIIYNPEDSVSLHGNSGPYLQYSLVRAKSIIRRVGNLRSEEESFEYLPEERTLVRKIGHYPGVVATATAELLPSHLCSYLQELAQEFNRFYENNRIADDPREAIRIEVLSAYCNVLADGLDILGISCPESM